MSTSSNSTPRIFTRGETTPFRVGFFADENQTTPLVPISPDYPTYTIFDPSGTAIQTGTGIMESPGQYKLDFMVPKDAPLSYFHQAPQRYGDEGQGTPLTANDARYRIEWQMVTDANYQVNFVEEFDVRDVAVTQSLNRELQSLVLSGDPFRLTWRTATMPAKIQLRFAIRGHENCPTIEEEYDSTLPPGAQGNVQWVKDGDSYVFYVDVQKGVTQGNTMYIALWTITETTMSLPQTEFNLVISIRTGMLPLITHLRMLVDKFQKRLGRVQAYEDSDLIEYLSQGLRMVNLSYPTTGYTMDSVPDDFQPLIMLAAGWYALQAQKLLEADLSFNFSGQSVTLSVDRGSQLDSAASAMMEMFNQQIGPAKMAYVRKTGGVGTVAGRAYNYRQQYQYVYRLNTMGSNTLLNTLTKIGLL